MKENAILIRYHSNKCDDKLLFECDEELNKQGIRLCKLDLKDTILHAALDFIDLDFIAINYLIIQNYMINGSYDLFKYTMLKLWSSIRPHDIKDVPFTLRINGIPTINGPENISCKVCGPISEDQKNNIINKSFELAKSISDNNVKLLERSAFYNAFDAHIFNIDPISLDESEIDIEAEVRKRTKE